MACGSRVRILPAGRSVCRSLSPGAETRKPESSWTRPSHTNLSIASWRAVRQDSNKPLSPYLKPLLGGMSNLRGFASGTAAGDTLMALSAEAIVPLTSPLDVGKMGVSVFTDAGTTYDKGTRLTDQTLKRGYGGSLWFAAAFLRLNIAVAHGRGSTTRVHVGGSVSF